MNAKRLLSGLAALVLVGGATLVAADKIELEGVKCVIAPRAAKADKSAEYKEGTVFFCCGNCQGKFTSDPEKFATGANKQLVATEQYEQKGCPLSGGELNEETKIEIDGVEVAFCCFNCQGKVKDAEEKEQLVLCFSDKAFEKAFKKAEKEEDDSK